MMNSEPTTMKALCLHSYGEPTDVLHLEEVAIPRPIQGQCVRNCDAVGDGITNVKLGDLVFGVPDYMGQPTGGAAEYAILKVFVSVPEGLDLTAAVALPMVVETAARSIDLLGVTPGQTLMVNGGGTMSGFAAVQMALLRGVQVIATAGETFAARLRELGAKAKEWPRHALQ